MAQRKTQNQMILEHLNRFGSITPREAMEDYQIVRLASRIDELKKLGFNIEAEIKKHKLTGKRYAKYRRVQAPAA